MRGAALGRDTEAVRQKGFEAVTNFDLSEYADVLADNHVASRQEQQQQQQQQQQQFVAAAGEVVIDSLDRTSGGGATGAAGDSAAVPPASIQQRLLAASHSAHGAMRPGPAAERDPCAQAIKTVKAFFAPNHKPKVRAGRMGVGRCRGPKALELHPILPRVQRGRVLVRWRQITHFETER